MSPSSTPRELAELTVRRLNRAATDLGLTLRGRPLFALGVVGDALDDTIIEVNAVEYEDYPRLATMLEKLAERVTPAPHAHPGPGQQSLFEANRLT